MGLQLPAAGVPAACRAERGPRASTAQSERVLSPLAAAALRLTVKTGGALGIIGLLLGNG